MMSSRGARFSSEGRIERTSGLETMQKAAKWVRVQASYCGGTGQPEVRELQPKRPTWSKKTGRLPLFECFPSVCPEPVLVE
jgi:hypothetical protein